MATVLFGAVMFNLAEVTRMIEIARALDSRHHPVFFGFESDYVHLVEGAGFEYRALAPKWTAEQRAQALRFDQAKTLRNPFTKELVSARVSAERALIRETGARAVVIGTNITSMISARAEGVTLWYAVPFALTRPHVEQTRRLDLATGGASPVEVAVSAAFRWAYTRAPFAPRAFRSVARANGVETLRTIASLLEADRNLLTVMPDELTGYSLPDSYQRVGPIFAHLDAPIPEIVIELAERPEPLVYLGLGSSANRRLVLDAASTLGRLPINVVAPIRHYLNADDVLPPNVHVTDLVPAHRLGDLIDAAVLHGGQGTVQTACATGVPFVGMGLQPEQTWNVRVCVRRGNAIALAPRHAKSARLALAVSSLLTDESFRRIAAQVRDEYTAEDGAAVSAGLIEANLAL